MYINKPVKIAIIIGSIAIIAIIAVVLLIIFNKKETPTVTEEKTIFTIDKISIYSGVSVKDNSLEYEKAYWDLDISQFSDIAIYINNKNSDTELTPENTVKSLFIDNIVFTQTPSKGTPYLFYKKYTDFGMNTYSRDNLFRNDIEFKIYTSNETNFDIPCFYSDCSNPITLGFENKDIEQNYILLYDGNPLTYNGTALKRANISLEAIVTTISFNVTITNNQDENFTCNVIIPIELKDDKTSIYAGDIQITQQPNFIFKKI